MISKLLLLLFSFILFFILGYTCINKKTAPAIQDDINKRVTLSLDKANLDSVKVDVNGRDLLLTGTVANEKQRIAAEQAAQVSGVNTIENHLIINPVSPVLSRYYLDIQKNNVNEITLNGYVSNTSTHHSLVSYVMESFDKPVITDNLQEEENPLENWASVVEAGVDALKLLQSGQLTVKNQQLNLSGETIVARNYVAIDEMLSASLPKEYRRKLDINFVPHIDTNAQKQAAEATCQSKLKEAVSQLNITFQTGSTVITSSSKKQLDEFAKIKTQCLTQVLHIKGHTDSQGNDRINRLLSQKRATAVKNHLINNGVDTNRMTAEGFGETQPVADNTTRAGRGKNRRIEIIIEDIDNE